MRALLRDLRSTLRQSIQHPAFSLTLVLTLALGIGTASAVFSLVYGILLRPYPYREPERLVRVESVQLEVGDNRQGASLDELADLRRESRTLAEVGAALTLPNTMELNGQAHAVTLTFISAQTLPLLGVRPLLGRMFEPQEDVLNGDVKKAILGYGLWQRLFSGDREIVGKTIHARGDRYLVVGVMPPGFGFPEQSDLWVPLMARYAGYKATWWQHRGYREHQIIARLREGVSVEQASTEMSALSRRFEEQFRETNEGVQFNVVPLREAETGTLRPYLLMLLAATGLVLLVGCLNAANLMLARAAAREKEVVIRVALGAGRWPIVRQLLTESAAFGVVGGLLGTALAYGFIQAFPRLVPVDLPFWMRVEMDPAVVIFAVGLSLLTGLVFGLVPALQASRVDLNDVLKQGMRGSSGSSASARRLRDGLVIGEVALSILLLLGAGLMVRSFLNLQKVDMGVRTQGVATVYLARFVPNGSPEQLLAEYHGSFRRALDRIRQLPNVVSAAAAMDVPYSLFGSQRDSRESLQFTVRGQNAAESFRNAPAEPNYVSPGYFDTLGVKFVEGRDFTELDDRSKPNYIIINRRMAEDLFGRASAVGQQLRWGREGGFSNVIGVVDNVRYSPFDTTAGYEIYYTYSQIPMPQLKAVVAVRGDPAAMLEPLRAAVREADARIAIVNAKTLETLAGESLWQRRWWGLLFAAFAVLALTLAAVGLYGVVSYLVAQRTREIGIRMALGAAAPAVVGLVTGHGMKLVGWGSAAGLAAAFVLSHLVQHLLFGVSALDPLTFVLVPGVLAAAGLLACIVPALRAARIDPLVALRDD